MSKSSFAGNANSNIPKKREQPTPSAAEAATIGRKYDGPDQLYEAPTLRSTKSTRLPDWISKSDDPLAGFPEDCGQYPGSGSMPNPSPQPTEESADHSGAVEDDGAIGQ